MLKYLKHNEIDKKKWDLCVKNSQNGIIYAYSWYLDSYSIKWEAIILNDYEAVFPITIYGKTFKRFQNPLFASQLGLFYKDVNHLKLLENILNLLPKNIYLFDFQLNFGNNLYTKKFRIETKYCQYIDLKIPYSEIFSKYSNNLKRILKKQNDYELVFSNDLDTLINLYSKNKNIELAKNNEHINLLRYSLKSIILNSEYKIVEYRKNQQVQASALFSFSNNRIIYMKGSSNEQGRCNNAMHIIMDFMIKSNSQTNLIFDFGGSSAENVRRFNYHFTKKEYTYQRIYKNDFIFKFFSFLKKIKNNIILSK